MATLRHVVLPGVEIDWTPREDRVDTDMEDIPAEYSGGFMIIWSATYCRGGGCSSQGGRCKPGQAWGFSAFACMHARARGVCTHACGHQLIEGPYHRRGSGL